MTNLGPEPPALFLTRADILAWLPGLTPKRWRRVRPGLRPVFVPGGPSPAYPGQRPMYAKRDVYTALVAPLLRS